MSEPARKGTADIALAHVQEHNPYPAVDHGFKNVAGHKILVQIKLIPPKTKGGLSLPQDTQEEENLGTCVGKVVAMGPGCYKDRISGAPWAAGPWCQLGQFVRIHKSGIGFVKTAENGSDVIFRLINDDAVQGEVTDEQAHS